MQYIHELEKKTLLARSFWPVLELIITLEKL